MGNINNGLLENRDRPCSGVVMQKSEKRLRSALTSTLLHDQWKMIFETQKIKQLPLKYLEMQVLRPSSKQVKLSLS